jgi:hypothetical protein
LPKTGATGEAQTPQLDHESLVPLLAASMRHAARWRRRCLLLAVKVTE